MRQDKATGRLQLSATDLSSFLGCHHRTALDMATAAGRLTRPEVDDPQLEALFKRGLDHEAVYVESLKAGGANRVIEIANGASREVALAETIDAMRAGADVIVQGALGNARWFGRPDVLRKAAGTSRLGAWSYEVIDTKLARETKAGTILQLALYCSLLEDTLGQPPELFHVVTPDNMEPYRLADYAAYFRLQRARLEASTEENDDALAAANYPEPVDHCDICPWSGRCDAQRRKDDHLSIIAGISRMQRRELVSQQIETMASLAAMPIKPMTFRPKRGAAETYERVREQARVQIAARTRGPVFEVFDVVAEQGLCRLPEPSPGDIFLDLEGDPFAGPMSGPPMLRGREYLFGVASLDASGEPAYQALWAENEAEEKTAFQAVVDQIVRAKADHPGAHVYHYAPYEPSAFKRLMGRHATREQEIDALLRSETFVDLYAVVRQSLRAGVERYSIKNMEPLYGFVRDVNLRDARRHLQAMEIALEQNRLADLLPEVRVAVEGYNRDDCVSTLRLRNWLEEQRANLIAKGQAIARPEVKSGEPSKPLDERQQKVEALRGQLLGVNDPARHILAYLLDFHRREDKAAWWEYFRLIELSDEELLDERGAVSGLEYVGDMRPEKRSVIQRYRYPPQEMELKRNDELKLTDQTKWADVVAVDRAARTIDVKVGKRQSDRPTAAFAHKHINPKAMEDAIYAIGESLVNSAADPLAIELLYRNPPRTRVATELKDTVLAIQGPPGTGKTYTGGKMICDLVAAGKTVGIAATGHKVIRNLFDAVRNEARSRSVAVALARKPGGDEEDAEEDDGSVRLFYKNDDALALLASGAANVIGGTAWLWSDPDLRKSVDVLFIDEAGQVSLANALAMTQGAHALVLLGDPQQLDQPTKGTHPDGVGVSALEHVLGQHKTMPEEQGMFLAETWRFGEPICDFTSEVFYEGKLRPTSQKDLNRQQLTGGPINGAGLFVVDVEHDGNRNGSDEEVAAVERLVGQLLAPSSQWIDDQGTPHQMTARDILVVSPYNVQVSRLQERLAARGVEAGTVDKFQGRQAPVVIYSMATSRPEDAPRGMEFLYSLNRLNVATSRAKCAAIVVASPRLMEPECRNPGQMQLANALCRFRELARLMSV